MQPPSMFVSMRRITLVAVAVIAVPALTSTAAAQSAAAKKIPPGSYTLVPDSNFTAGVDVGAFSIRVDGDSSMVVEQGGTLVIRSKLAYAPDQLTWTDVEGQLACPGTARYTVAVDGKSGDVRLTPIEDSCAERSGVLAQVRLVRQR